MQEIKIDFDNPGLPHRLDVVENDAQSRFFKAVLYKDGKAYVAPSGATYSIMYRGFGPQNEGWYDTINDGAGKRAACSVSGNVVTCEIARQALRVPGHVSVMLCVTRSNGYMLHGWPIDCNCRNDNYTGGTSVESYFYITQITNADWTSAIKTWEELKNMIDPTLSVSGKAADAAKVGEAVGQIKEDKVDKSAIGYRTTGKVVPDVCRAQTFIGAGGNITEQARFDVFDAFEVKKGETIKFYAIGYKTNVAVLSETTAEQTLYTPVITSTDSLPHDFEYKAEESGYYAICSENKVTVTYEVIGNDLNGRLSDVEEKSAPFEPIVGFGKPNLTHKKYVNSRGNVLGSSGYSMTDPVYIPAGYKLVLIAKCIDANSVSMISEYNPRSRKYTAHAICTDTTVTEYSYTLNHPAYIVISFFTSSGYSVKLIRDYHALSSYVSSFEKANDADVLTMFNALVCIGDSLTWSQVYTSVSTSRQAYQPYPKILEKRTRTPTEMFARTGATPASWWSEFNAKCMVERDNACYIVYLGTNGGLTDTIDADCPSSESTTAWADTNTGYYGRILQSISDLEAKAVLVKVYATGGNLSVTNNVIEKFGERFGFPVIENEDLGKVYHLYPNKSGENGVHYNDLGYAAFVYQLLKNVGSLAPEKLALLIPN